VAQQKPLQDCLLLYVLRIKLRPILWKKNIIRSRDEIKNKLTNEMQAAPSKILTRSSSNCSKISFQSGLVSSAGNSITS